MGGGLMQLVAYGAQDFYLTGNPQITFFKVVYRRHTNFATESIEQTFNGQANWNGRAVCNLNRSGDLVTKMYLRVNLPGADAVTDAKIGITGVDSAQFVPEWAWISRLGHYMLNDVIIEIGGTQVDKLYGDWLNVWYELARNFAHDRGYGQMIGDTPELTTLARSHEASVLYIPIPFACHRNDGLALPVIALQYHDIKITVDFAPFEQMINYNGIIAANSANVQLLRQQLNIPSCSLFVDYVYLDNEERKRFAQASHEYLFEQLQFTGVESINGTLQKYRLNLNHPCKELVWNQSSGRYFAQPFLAYDPNNVNLALVNATKRFVLRCAAYDADDELVTATGGSTYQSSSNAEVITIPVNAVEPNDALGSAYYRNSHGAVVNLLPIFRRINAIALSPVADIDNITILGSLLTVEEYSVPTNIMFNSSTGFTSEVPEVSSGVFPNDGSASLDVTVHAWNNYGSYLDGSHNPNADVLLQLNGQDRFQHRDGAYFNYVQPYQCHTNTPADGINVYSFALSPEQHQPSGTCNFSRIDNATLNIQYDNTFDYSSGVGGSFAIYATNYNVLRVMSGMGGLAYSN